MKQLDEVIDARVIGKDLEWHLLVERMVTAHDNEQQFGTNCINETKIQ